MTEESNNKDQSTENLRCKCTDWGFKYRGCSWVGTGSLYKDWRINCKDGPTEYP